MLTLVLYLSTAWFLIGFAATLLLGARLRRSNRLLSLAWLLVVLLLGDFWAVQVFGPFQEIAILSGVAILIGLWWIWKLPDWNALAHVAWTTTLLASLLYVAYTFAVTAFTPLHPVAFVAAMVFFFIELAALALGLTFAFEGLDIVCRVRWQRRVDRFAPVPGYAPKVSIHVPAYNEPPEVVEATLRSLAQLDYPNYEVLVIDNNTPHETMWRPVKALCRQLGPHFRFLHLDRWPGYKSGALNFALTQTAPDAEIIAICDADYHVEPNFLREMVPAFINPQIAFLQTPQDYTNWQSKPFLEACYYGYRYFFKVSMPSRNERNAIIFAGTMGLIRKSVLHEIGGWDEWCITEDAEASLRILKHGYQSIYVDKAYGRGLIPFDFDALKKQRFRWCFGGIQILRKHWEALMPWAHWVDPDNHLTLAQRYYYLVGGLQWYNDLLNLLFTFFLILGAIISTIPTAIGIRPLTTLLLIMPAVFLVIGLWRFLWVLRYTLRLNWYKALQTMTNFFSLAWAVTLGSIQGLIQPRGVFLRTPKTEGQLGLVRAIRATQWETGIGVLCAFIGLGLLFTQPRISSIILGLLLCWHA
ncbi:MAG TPA: glycosyltransferase, partial [Anaerolineae bacterium]|nr:glycosyltransferase [Anaerolineae bacterium]